jgi:hypothetical protein
MLPFWIDLGALPLFEVLMVLLAGMLSLLTSAPGQNGPAR